MSLPDQVLECNLFDPFKFMETKVLINIKRQTLHSYSPILFSNARIFEGLNHLACGLKKKIAKLFRIQGRQIDLN